MTIFEQRKDRFEFFESFENPMLNITFKLSCPNFIFFCKEQKIPPFHFFLYCICRTIKKIDNFNYRIFDGDIIKVNDLIPSYTVMNKSELFNYTKFNDCDDFSEFLKRSLAAKKTAEHTTELINTGFCMNARELKNFVFITSLPWLEFTSIHHPTYHAKSSDIPAFAWGKFSIAENKLNMPFSIQAHHGFVDGYHIHLFTEELTQFIDQLISDGNSKLFG